jgi:hypothetical protein
MLLRSRPAAVTGTVTFSLQCFRDRSGRWIIRSPLPGLSMERMFTDRRGTDWAVTEIKRTSSRGLTAQSWLCFRNGDGSRVRVPHEAFRGDWRRLRQTDLNRLLEEARSLPAD